MNIFFGLIGWEIQLYLRSKSFWLMAILAVVFSSLPILEILLLEFLVAGGCGRDRRAKFDHILVTLPYSTPLMYLARAAAGFCLLISLWPFMVFVVGVLPDFIFADWLFSTSSVAYFFLKYLATCATTVGFVFIVGEIAGKSVWLYSLIGVFWAVQSYFASNLSWFPIIGQLLLFGQGMMLPGAPSVAVGYFPQQELLDGFALWQFAVAFLFLFTAIMIQMLRRGEPIGQSKLVIGGLVALVVGGGLSGYFILQELGHREAAFQAVIKDEKTGSRITAEQAIADAHLLRYQLALQLQTSAHQLQGDAQLQLTTSDSAAQLLAITLRNYFQVKEVSIEGQAELLEWSRQGSRLLVHIPEKYRRGNPFTLHIIYAGEVWEWSSERTSYPSGPVNFIATEFSLLRSGDAWYPLLGDQPLYEKKKYVDLASGLLKETLWAKKGSHASVPFQMTVDIDNDSMVGANLEQISRESIDGTYKQRYHFAAEKGKDVFLITGPYQYTTRRLPGRSGKSQVYSFVCHENGIDEVVHSLGKADRFLGAILQPKLDEQEIDTLVELPAFLFATTDGVAIHNLLLNNTVALSENSWKPNYWHLDIIKEIRENKRILGVLQQWWQADITSELINYRNGNIQESIMLYMYVLYIEKTKNPDFYNQAKENILNDSLPGNGEGDFTRASLISGDVTKNVFLTLDTIRNSPRGEQQLAKTLQALYSSLIQHETVSADDFGQIVTAAAVTSGCTVEQVAEVEQYLLAIKQKTNEYAMQPLAVGTSLTISSFNLEEWLP